MTDPEFPDGLPASLDAERTILGAILLDNAVYKEAASTIKPEDFSTAAHGAIFHRIGEMGKSGMQADLVTLAEELRRRKELEQAGGLAYLSSLLEGLPHRLAMAQYIRIVKEKAMLRQIIQGCSDAIAMAADQAHTPAEIVERLGKSLKGIRKAHK